MIHQPHYSRSQRSVVVREPGAKLPVGQHPRAGPRTQVLAGPCGRMARCLLLLLPLLLAAVSGNTALTFNMSIEYVAEDLPVGSTAFWLRAVDADDARLLYSMSGQDAPYFSVNASTGQVLLAASLDREAKTRLSVTITVTDQINTPVSKKLPIIVEDRNDNAPIFQGQPYVANVSEAWPRGSVIYTVLAKDPDLGNAARVHYEVASVTPDDAKNHLLFSMLPNGTLVLNGSLSYTSQSTYYQLQIKATDGGGLLNSALVHQSSVAYLSVNVLDEPDLAPQFLGEPYVASVPENCPLGTPVLSVLAVDRDKGVNYAVNYSLLDASGPFAINLTTGTITLHRALDREQLPSEEVLLHVLAQEEKLDIYAQAAQASATVTIQVTDVNDNSPQFYQCELPACDFAAPQTHFQGSIEEHAPARVPVGNLSIVAHDPDKGTNGTFELRLQGQAAATFSVSPSRLTGTGAVQILVKDPSMVDYERFHQMTVEIVANDTGNPGNCCSSAMVTIHVLDVNDHSPTFGQDVYRLQVLENSPPGTVVSNVTATDPDSADWGRITYRLLPESILDVFAVNASSGEVLVHNGSWLDRETRSVYYATLQAVDGGNMTGSTLLEISLLDANDNPPVLSGSYNVFVSEGQSVSVQIQAFDSDEPGTNNSRLRFQLEPGPYSTNFSLDPETGLLRSVGPLDCEAIDPALQGKVVVTVRVHDLGVPSLSSLVNVTITVEDVNDNLPVFLNEPFFFSVREGLAGAFVGSVEAMDADQTEAHHRISFQLVSGGGSSSFLLRSIRLRPGHYQGNLSLDPDVALDYDRLHPANFTLTVQAENTGTGDVLNVVTAAVQVQVLDVNDEPPSLVQASLKAVSMAEGAPPGLLTTLQASDPDTNHSLRFQELATACQKGAAPAGHVCQGWFYLAPNGSVFVNSSQIDYEACDRVTLTLRVEDTRTEKGNPYSSNETLTILISDVNDNSPRFQPTNETFVVVPEVAPVGLPVAVVKAKDADSGLQGAVTFSISRELFLQENGPNRTLSNVFTVATAAEGGFYVGSVQVASSLDGSLKGRYQVTVEARDGGTPSLSSSTVLLIFTVDQSYRVQLVFSTSVNEVQANVDRIKAALTMATRTTVYVAAIQAVTEASQSRAQVRSAMEAYFVYSNGTALELSDLSIMVQSHPQALTELIQLGLTIIGPGAVVPPSREQELIGIIVGLASGLALLLLIMTLALVATSRSHRRKLKAMTALKAASTLVAHAAQQGPAIPGTNKYNAEGANPVLNLTLDTPTDLGFEEDSDAASVNSLDENSVESSAEGGPGPQGLQLGQEAAPAQPGSWEEPLTAALQAHHTDPARRPGDPNQTVLTFSNPCLDTTDL
ncbi:cadherin-related family member 2 isoform X2 [Pelodiscus sinensis]|uniref:cadherin-related family member 2 isoform X2 n=1 Tax=Pelodiscus sinensis TaxID=13735 RepID=UPI003F6BFE7E